MSGQSVEDRIRGIAGETPPTAFPMAAVVRRGRRARRRRSALRIGTAAAVVGLAAGAVPAMQHFRTPAAGPPAEAAAAPATLTVTCDGDRATVGSDTVAARADGVHVTVVQGLSPAWAAGYRAPEVTPGGARPETGAFHDLVPDQQRQEQVWVAPPGRIQVYCASETARAGSGQGPMVPVDVVDPAGHWVENRANATCDVNTPPAEPSVTPVNGSGYPEAPPLVWRPPINGQTLLWAKTFVPGSTVPAEWTSYCVFS